MRGKTFLSYLHIHYMKAVIKNCGKSRKFKFNTPSWLSCVPRYLWLLGFPCMQPSYGFLLFSQRGFLPLDPIPWSQTCTGLLALPTTTVPAPHYNLHKCFCCCVLTPFKHMSSLRKRHRGWLVCYIFRYLGDTSQIK